MVLIIGFHGAAGSGKDTAFLTMVEIYPRAVRLSFAEPLKRAAEELGFSYQELWGTQEEKETLNPDFGITPRAFLQKLGAEFLCKIHPEFLIIRMRQELEYAELGETAIVCITDVRSPKEAEFLRANGAIIVRLTRGPPKTTEELAASHITEQPLPAHLVDHEIKNDGSFDELREKLRDITSGHLG